MKKRYFKVLAFFVCITVYCAFLVSLSINIAGNNDNGSHTGTNMNNYYKEKENKNNSESGEIKYRYVQNINELIDFTSNYSSSGGGVPLIVIGLDGNYFVDGIDTGITASSQMNTFGENGAYIVFVENTGETDEELIYSIMYSNEKVKEFKVNKETKEITSEFKLDIKVGENGNWFINDKDTGISSKKSSYEDYLEEYDRKLSKEDWLKLIKEGKLELKKTVNVLYYPDNGDYPYTVKYIEGTKFVEFDSPKKDGFTFIGWLNNNNEYMENGKTVIDSDIELHAIYKENNYFLTLNSNNGESNEHLIVHYNEELSLFTPTKKGFTFLGWYYNDKLMNSLYSINKDAMYVAKWCPNYTLNRANSDSALCNDALTIKDLSMFDGWYCDDMLVLYLDNPVINRIMTSMNDLDRASSTSLVINNETKLDIVGETKSKKTAMIQELDYESEPRYYVRT